MQPCTQPSPKLARCEEDVDTAKLKSPLLDNWAGLKRADMVVKTTGGHVVTLKPQRLIKKKITYTYSCSDCSFGCNNPGGLASHRKFKHPATNSKVSGAMGLFVQNPKLEAEVFCKFIMRDIVNKALGSIDVSNSVKHWSLQKDDKRKHRRAVREPPPGSYAYLRTYPVGVINTLKYS